MDEKQIEKAKAIVKEMCLVSFPTIMFYFCLFSQQSITLAFISQTYHDARIVAGIGISNLYVNCTTLVVSVGLVSGLEVLASNAYGAKEYYLMGMYIHRGRLISLCYIVFASIFNFFFAFDILSILDVDKEIIHNCQKYIYFYMLMMFSEVQFCVNFRYLSIIGKPHVSSNTLILTLILHPLWCYIFIYQLDFGIVGAGLSMIITQSIGLFITSYYLHYFNPVPESYFMINKDCFKGWKEYLKVAFPIVLQNFGEWVGYEIQTLFVLKVGITDYSVQIILTSLELLIYTFTLSFAITTTIKVADTIVKDSIENLKFLIKVAISYSAAVLALVCILIYIFRHSIMRIYATDNSAYQLGVEVMVYLLCFATINNIFSVMGSVFRGLSYLNIPSLLSLVNFYFVQLILSYVFVFLFDMRIRGVWLSLITGTTLLAGVFFYILYNLDLEEFRQNALDRIKNENKELGKIIEMDAFDINDSYNKDKNKYNIIN